MGHTRDSDTAGTPGPTREPDPRVRERPAAFREGASAEAPPSSISGRLKFTVRRHESNKDFLSMDSDRRSLSYKTDPVCVAPLVCLAPHDCCVGFGKVEYQRERYGGHARPDPRARPESAREARGFQGGGFNAIDRYRDFVCLVGVFGSKKQRIVSRSPF